MCRINERHLFPPERSSIFKIEEEKIRLKAYQNYLFYSDYLELEQPLPWNDWFLAEKSLCILARRRVEENTDSFYDNLQLHSSLASILRFSAFLKQVKKGELSIFVDIPKTTFEDYEWPLEFIVTIYVGPVEPGHEVWANCIGFDWDNFDETECTWKQNIDLFGTQVEVWELQISYYCDEEYYHAYFFDGVDFDVRVKKKDNFGNIATAQDNNEGNYFLLLCKDYNYIYVK